MLPLVPVGSLERLCYANCRITIIHFINCTCVYKHFLVNTAARIKDERRPCKEIFKEKVWKKWGNSAAASCFCALTFQSADKRQNGTCSLALIQQTEKLCAAVEKIRTSLRNADPGDCSPERYTNLVFCPVELKDTSLDSAVQQYLNSRPFSAQFWLTALWCSFYCKRSESLSQV